jgi:hypothetical protein
LRGLASAGEGIARAVPSVSLMLSWFAPLKVSTFGPSCRRWGGGSVPRSGRVVETLFPAAGHVRDTSETGQPVCAKAVWARPQLRSSEVLFEMNPMKRI